VSAWDAVVVGAGPAGAIAALGLARRGVSVLLLERAAFPRWKVCGACLSPGSRAALGAEGLGGLADSLGGKGLRRLLLHAGHRCASVALNGSVAVSRSALDGALVEAATSAGATFWAEARVTSIALEGEERRVRLVRAGAGVEVRARLVVDASGLGRGLEDGSSLPDEVANGSRVGLGSVLRGDRYPVEDGDLHMAVAHSGYVGLVRVEDGSLNLAAALDPECLRAASPEDVVSGVLVGAGLPPLRERPLTGWRGTPLLTRARPGAGGCRLFRVGDAAGYVEPFTGEGICWALGAGRAAARLAAAAVERWSDELLEEWRTYRVRSLGRSQRLCRVLSSGLRRPWLVRASVAALSVAPGLAVPFVSRAARAPAELRA
jgi:flavin-dependent dehydrogenase